MNLKELAAILGLSQTTVSRALNGYPEVSPATRDRVREAAERLNYHPNVRARSLATGSAMAIGNVIPLTGKHDMVNPIFADFLAGAGETYARNGYDMLLSVVREDDEVRTYEDMAGRHSVDGVIVHGPRVDDPRIPLLKRLKIPFVVHGRTGADCADYSWLDVNHTRSFERATQLLLDLGHRRIALIDGLQEMDFARRRRLGYCAALERAGITPDPAYIRHGEMTESYGYETAREMLQMPSPPTAFMVASYFSAIGVRRAVGGLDLKIGSDISVITHDDGLSHLGNAGDVPAFTATRSSVRAHGRRCAEILLSLIQSGTREPIQELWQAELTLGISTGPCKERT